MYYVTGDIHGNQELLENCISGILKPGDTMIVVGDFGAGFFGENDRSEESFYDYVEQQPYTILFCDGNHENFHKLNSYKEEIWNKGSVHRIRGNLIHLIRGEIYELEGRRLFVMGGGYSFDRTRREQGVSWWAEEMPNDQEYRKATENLERVNYDVNSIVTHTAPDETVEYLSRMGLGIENNAIEEKPLTSYLRWVEDIAHYQKWFFGHFHVDMELWKNQYALFDGIRELESGKLVKMRR